MRLTLNLRRVLLIILTLLLLFASATSRSDQKVVRIGVLAFNGPAYTLKRWQPTIEYLNQSLPDYHFVIIPADIPTLDNLVESRLVDFTLTNGIQFLSYKYQHQAIKMLNLNPFHGKAQFAIGSALIGRQSEPEINHWSELKNRKVISVSEEAFGGFRTLLREFLSERVEQSELKKLEFIGYPQQNLLYKVLNGEADFAIAPTCLLERKVRDGTIPRNTLKVMRRKTDNPEFACHTSSQLYPNWTLARMAHVPADYANHVARLLLSIPRHSPVAVTGLYGGWSVPIDDSAIFELMEVLNINIQPSHIEKLWLQYRGWALVALALLLLFISYHLRVNYLVYVRSTQLRREVSEHKHTARQLEQEQEQLFKAQRILLGGELTSGIAHELNQPLMAISAYAAGCKNRLRRSPENMSGIIGALENIEDQTQVATQIIQRMRNFMKVHSKEKKVCTISTIVKNTVFIFQHTLDRHRIQLTMELLDTELFIDPILIQQLIANLIQNSIDALHENDIKSRHLTIKCNVAEQFTLEVIDNGCGLTEQQLKNVFMPFYSSKPNGLGLGMIICKRIIEAHDGSIKASQLQSGCKFTITLPLHKQIEEF